MEPVKNLKSKPQRDLKEIGKNNRENNFISYPSEWTVGWNYFFHMERIHRGKSFKVEIHIWKEIFFSYVDSVSEISSYFTFGYFISIFNLYTYIF